MVARRFTQKRDLITIVVKHNSITVLVAILVLLNLELEQMDANTTFLHGNLEEKILMSRANGFKENGQEHYVYLLHKFLYRFSWFEYYQEYGC